MTPQQHKARGVLLVTQAFAMRRENQPFPAVIAKLEEAQSRFAPEKGNDDQLFKLCTKHKEVLADMRSLERAVNTFFNKQRGVWDLKGRFWDVQELEGQLNQFFTKCDSFVLVPDRALQTRVHGPWTNGITTKSTIAQQQEDHYTYRP